MSHLFHFPLAPEEYPRMFPTAIHEQKTAFDTLRWSGPTNEQKCYFIMSPDYQTNILMQDEKQWFPIVAVKNLNNLLVE